MSHERSITVKINKKFFNLNTVVKGKRLPPKVAIDHAIKSKSLGKGFLTKENAVKAAEKRSQSFSGPKNPSGQIRRKRN